MNELTGTLTGTGGGNMQINGAFFRGATDPVKDVAGRFSVTASRPAPTLTTSALASSPAAVERPNS